MKEAIGVYVRVESSPDSWESSGENPQDLLAYVSHVGVVVEQDENMEMVLVRFPSHRSDHETGQRWIEVSKLTIVSMPLSPIPLICLEG